MRVYGTILLAACAPLWAQHYTIATVAGGGLSSPTSVAVDGAGDVYVADWSGFIRKIWVSDGAMTVVAGTGVLGYGGDGGQATLSNIGKSIALAVDGGGNLYFADGDNNRIRRVDGKTGIITTVAGPNGVSQPTGIAIDAAGDLYFSSGWSRIQKFTAGSGMIETIAGQATTSFGGDGGPAIDALFWDPVPGAVGKNGELYLADFENSRVRMIKAGVVTTFAGEGVCKTAAPPLNVLVCQGGFAGDGGPAQAATLNYPATVAMDARGNLFIADSINHRIRRVDAITGIISTIAGNGTNGFSGDGGPALNAAISFPAGIAVDAQGRVYFADENNNRVRVLMPAGAPVVPLRRGQRR